MNLNQKRGEKLEKLYRAWEDARSAREMRCPVFTSGKTKSRAADILSLVPAKEILDSTVAYEESLKAERAAWKAYRKFVVKLVRAPRAKA